MKPIKSMIKFLISWNIKQFTIGFLFGVIVSLIYNLAMYYGVFIEAYQNEKNTNMPNSLKLSKNCFEKSEKTLTNFLESENKCAYSKKGPRILCTIFTYKKNFDLKAKYVEQTWGKRCDKLIFVSGYLNKTEQKAYSHMDIVYLNVTDTSRLSLTPKTIQTLIFANKHLINEFDWILKADDDTYIIMENLKRFLFNKCTTDMNYYGFQYKPLKPDTFTHDFNSGGAGYVISKNVVKMFSEKYSKDERFCRNITGSEDVDIAKCLKEINVLPGNTRDKFGLERFHPLSYESMWNISPQKRTYNHSKFPLKKKEDCCSKSSISFHYTSGQKALQLEFLLYKLRPMIL